MFHALRRVRDHRKARHLWVDAICINQQDDVEKTSQVAAMGNIYESAARSIVWLGQESLQRDCELAIAFIR